MVRRALVSQMQYGASCGLRAGGEAKWPLADWLSVNGSGTTVFASYHLALGRLTTHCTAGS